MYAGRLIGRLVEAGGRSHTNKHENTLASSPKADPSRATWASWSVYRDRSACTDSGRH